MPAVAPRWNVITWLIGFGLGMVGDQIFLLVLVWSANAQASPEIAGLVVGLGSVPRAALILFGGAVADRVGARRVAILSDGARFGLMALFASLAAVAGLSIGTLIALAMLFGAIDAFFVPAVGALPTRLVHHDRLARLQSLRSIVFRISTVAGPPVGGWLIGVSGLAGALAANAVLFAVSCVAVMATRELPYAHRRPDSDGPARAGALRNRRQLILGDTIVGIRYVLGEPGLRALLLLITVSEFAFSGPFSTGLTLLAASREWSAADVGAAMAFFGAGAASSALLIAWRSPSRRAGRVAVVAIAFMGIGVLLIGVAPTRAATYAAALFAGVCSGVCSTLFVTLFLTLAPPEFSARVMSSLSLAIYGAAPLSNIVCGLLAGWLSAEWSFVIFGGMLVAAGIAGMLARTVRVQRL